MDLILTLAGEAASGDELRSLRSWLLAEDELRGCVQALEKPPGPDHLGPVLDALRIVADPAAAVLAASLVAWLKSRVGAVRLVLKPRSGGEVELDVSSVRGLNTLALAELAEDVTRLVSADPTPDPPGATEDVATLDDGKTSTHLYKQADTLDS